MVLFQEFLHDSFIKAAEIDDSDLASEVRHVLYDLIGPGLPQRKLILVGINTGYQVDESIDRKGVVLGGYRAQLLGGLLIQIPLFQQLGLLQDLPGIGQEFRTVGRQRDSPGCPVEDLNP